MRCVLTNYKKLRQIPSIIKESSKSEWKNSESSLMNDFQKNLEKISVQTYEKEQQSIYDQISSIMGNKPRHPSVQAAVKDMQDRSGLTEYIKKIQYSSNDIKQKKASGNEEEISIFREYPQIKSTIDNIIQDNGGDFSVPIVLEKAKYIHSREISDMSMWDNQQLLEYIKRTSDDAQNDRGSSDDNVLGKRYVHNGDLDPSNTDAFHALNAVVKGK